MRLRPGSLVVLEGLDRTGKSTQRSALETATWDRPAPVVAHMPSGLTALTRAIYETTERQKITSALARQLLHLACHAENLLALSEARARCGVILDRWWWSTVAYGWFGGGLSEELSQDAFFGAVDMAWGGFEADVIFLFLSTYEEDVHNVSAVSDGYRWLADRLRGGVVEVPAGSKEQISAFLLDELRRRALIEG
jgi:dTMP kinase